MSGGFERSRSTTTHGRWRAAFFIVGLPGLALALLVRFTIREPPRGASEDSVADESPEAIAVVFRFLWSLRSFRHLAIAGGLHQMHGLKIPCQRTE